MKRNLHYLTKNHSGPLTRLVWTVSLLLMTGSLVKAQLPKQWDKTLGGSGSETASLVVATTDGGYLLAGYSNSLVDGDKTAPNAGDYDAWLVKVDVNGNKQWDHTYGGSGYDRLSSVLATADGGFLLGGGSSSTAEGDWDYWLVKVDATGTKQWEHTFGGPGTDEITSMVAATDGSYLLAGVSESPAGRDKTAPNMGFVDYWIVKVDVNGNKQWDKAFGSSIWDALSSVIATADGGYLLAGHSNSPVGGDKTEAKGNYDYWIVKVDAMGNKQWDKAFGSSKREGLASAIATSDGGYLLAGHSDSPDGGDKTAPNIRNYDYWLVKVNADGSKQWDKTFGGSGVDRISSAIATSDGGYLLAGYSNSPNDGDKIAPNKGDIDYWLVKVDANGSKQWEQTLGSSGADQYPSMIATGAGNYLLLGSSNSPAGQDKTDPNNGDFDYWLVKLGCVSPVVEITPSTGQLSCTTPTVTLTATSIPGASYAFSTGAAQVNGGNTAMVTQAGTYSVTVTTSSGCSATASVTVMGSTTPPTASLTVSGVISCVNPTVTLTAPVTAGANYVFSTGATQINGGNTATVTQAGTYSVVVTSFNGCSATASMTVSGSCSPPALGISVLHLDNDNKQLTNNSIRPYLQLANEGATSIAYQDITLRYWLTVEEFSPLNTNLVIDWAQLGTGKIKMKYVELPQPRQGAIGYIEYSFDSSAGSLAGGANSGPIQSRIGKNDWTAFNEADDYSYAGTINYTKNNRITAYLAGQLVWGTEPTLVDPVQSLKVYAESKSSATTNSISTYVQLRNEGNVSVSYPKLTVRYWLTAEGTSPLNVYLDYAQLGVSNLKGKLVRLTTPVPGADSYLELSFLPTLGNLYPLSGTGNIQYRIAKSDWSNFNQSNDHSYQPSGPMAPNPKMTVYLDGALVYGTEPSAPNARMASAEASSELKVVVLGNPILGNEVELEVGGADGQPIRLLLTDLQGHILAEKQVMGREAFERHQLSVAGQSAGIKLLRVSTPTQWQTVKLLKVN
ncbi:Beta-mannanase/endoglucanase A Includes: RecName: Full=Mannan endo-1,4-beta-mannosidase A [Fibrisoma limi BUZ 3]|uniref:ManA5 protein n=1 Tax=Fibrisoma limi BUZ 3 TaxID=1185876 RepID=I2GLR1_9BACT|nr:cellulose binding domain-containing protein [Fibrisoma limi]CCH54837.1 Beta-mannanase/endoglucanase A Includes: RecName: Full=Mannan endo-1,4-beta-mannosidase A [Fibrisoma limi BUZ 3]